MKTEAWPPAAFMKILEHALEHASSAAGDTRMVYHMETLEHACSAAGDTRMVYHVEKQKHSCLSKHERWHLCVDFIHALIILFCFYFLYAFKT